jgi:hypothetical protein
LLILRGKSKVKKRVAILVLGLSSVFSVVALAIFHEGTRIVFAQSFDTFAQKLAQEEEGSSIENNASSYEDIDQSQTLTFVTAASIEDKSVNLPVNAPLQNDSDARDPVTYNNVIDQFKVEENPRYTPSTKYNYCDLFVWDVTRAMGAEIPRWIVEGYGAPIWPYKDEEGKIWIDTTKTQESSDDPNMGQSANDMNEWLNEYGLQYSWHEVSAEQAQEYANQGYPTVASRYYAHKIGHIGLVRPGAVLNGPALAQAGDRNINRAHVYDIFPREGTQFFVHP